METIVGNDIVQMATIFKWCKIESVIFLSYPWVYPTNRTSASFLKNVRLIRSVFVEWFTDWHTPPHFYDSRDLSQLIKFDFFIFERSRVGQLVINEQLFLGELFTLLSLFDISYYKIETHIIMLFKFLYS